MIRFFLLAGGYGKRARPLSLVKPKPLFPLNGIPLIELMLDQLQNKGLNRGFINLHYRADAIRSYIQNRPDITFFYENKLSGSAILSRSADFLGSDLLLVINGDVFLEIPVPEMNNQIKKTKSDGILLVRKGDVSRYSSLLIQRGRYLGMSATSGRGWIYTGAALFKKSVVEKIKVKNFFRLLDDSRFDIRTMPYDGIWLDIGDARSYYSSNSEYRQYVSPDGIETNSMSENVDISPNSRVEGSIIWENSRITNHCRISHSIITGNMVLDSVCYANKIVTERGVYEL